MRQTGKRPFPKPAPTGESTGKSRLWSPVAQGNQINTGPDSNVPGHLRVRFPPQTGPRAEESEIPDEDEVQKAADIPRVADLFDQATGLPLVKVARTSPTPETGGAIAGLLRDRKRIIVRAIGAGALNQAVKAIACAASYLASTDNTLLVCVPLFQDLDIGGTRRTAISFRLATIPAENINDTDLKSLLDDVARQIRTNLQKPVQAVERPASEQ